MLPELDPTLTQDLNNPLQTGDYVELPFFAPYLYVINGKANLKKADDKINPPYFGGFGIAREDFENAVAEFGNPNSFGFYTMVNQEGNEYEIYAARAVAVAPIVTRERWVEGRSHLQILCLMAYRKDDHFAPWGPVVLTAKGYASKYLKNALKDWESFTTRVRREYAPKYPANLFYCYVGTFGDRKQIMVGGASQSPITPIELYKGKDGQATQDTLLANFVGAETVARMRDYKVQAADWLADWKEAEQTAVHNGNGNGHYEDDGYTMQNAPREESPFPF